MSERVWQAARTTRVVTGLPATVPFVGPEALERRSGVALPLRLGANESAFGPSPRALAAMHDALGRIHHYGDPENYDLRAALAERHGVSLGHVVVASGIDELLGLVVRAFVEHGETVVASLGAYPTVPFHVAGYGGTLERVPYRDDGAGPRNDPDALVAAARRTGARLLYLANPDNPTGSWHDSDALRALLDALPDGCIFLLDEAYSDFAPPEAVPGHDVVHPDDPRVIRFRTFSKAHGMAGARVGYALAAPETIAAFDKIRLHFGVNLVAQAGALASLGDPDSLRDVVAAVARGREEYVALARDLGLVPYPSATNFVAMDAGSAERARALLAALAERGVFVRMPGAAPLDRCIRVTVGTPEQRAAFAPLLRAAWAEVLRKN